jgi:hypothetical protein
LRRDLRFRSRASSTRASREARTAFATQRCNVPRARSQVVARIHLLNPHCQQFSAFTAKYVGRHHVVDSGARLAVVKALASLDPRSGLTALTGHKTRSVFERYNIVSECDLVDAARKLNAFEPAPSVTASAAVGRPEGLRYEDTPPAASSDRDGLAATKPRSGEVGHNLGTVGPNRGSRLRVSL